MAMVANQLHWVGKVQENLPFRRLSQYVLQFRKLGPYVTLDLPSTHCTSVTIIKILAIIYL